MFSHLGWALFLTSITAALHGICTITMVVAVNKLSRRHARLPVVPRRDYLFLLAGVVVALLVMHCLEALIRAIHYVRSGGLADLETALYFSITSYTTTGYGDVVMKADERLVGAVEGLAGTFMCGWSVALLVSLIQVIAKAVTAHAPIDTSLQERGD